MATRILLLVTLLLGACSDRGPAVQPELGGGKADVADRVPILAALAVGGEVRGEIVEDLEFHGYTLDVGADAVVTLDIPNAGTSRNLDSTLFVYGPADAGGGFGSDAIAFDDDSGWGKHSRLRELALPEAGTYLIVVGTHDGQGRGRYRLTASCEAGQCAPAGSCHPIVAADIRACADDITANDWSVSRLEAIELCTDAEAVGDAYDAACAGSSPPAFCDSYETFAVEHLPDCLYGLRGEVLDQSCVFGDSFRALRASPVLHVVSEREIQSAGALGALEREQVVLAVQASSHTDVTTAEEALSRVDQGVMNQLEVWDSTNRRQFTVYEYGAGDNSYGRLFAHGTTETVASIGDGEIRDCQVMHGPEGRLCAADEHCQGESRCLGDAAGRGLCIDTAADDHPADGQACTAADACPAGSGLTCAGLSRWDEGLCLPAWMRRRYAVERPEVDVPDQGTGESSVLARGLATVDMDVWLEAIVDHPDISQLEVSLVNPAGTEVVIYDGDQSGRELVLDGPVAGFSGDEAVNGLWTLRVRDRVAGGEGFLYRWALTVGSRWD